MRVLFLSSESLLNVNLSSRAMDEPGFLDSLALLVEGSPETACRVVLELPQVWVRALDAERAKGLTALRDRGVALALDRVTDPALDPDVLARLGLRFAKVTADLLLAGSSAHVDGDGVLAAALGRAGIELVAERVEREEAVPDLLDMAVPLAQGFVFAPPRPIRGEVLGAAPSSAPPVREAGASAPPRAPQEAWRGGHLPSRPVLQARRAKRDPGDPFPCRG